MDLETKTWRAGPTLPTHRCNSASVQFGDTFLLVSGQEGSNALSEYYDNILQFDMDNEEWIVREELLASPNDDVVAILVPDEYC